MNTAAMMVATAPSRTIASIGHVAQVPLIASPSNVAGVPSGLVFIIWSLAILAGVCGGLAWNSSEKH